MSVNALAGGVEQADVAALFPNDDLGAMTVPLGGEAVDVTDIEDELAAVTSTTEASSSAIVEDAGPIESLPPSQKRRPSIDMLPVDRQRELLKRERVLLVCTEQRENHGTKILPPKVRLQAAAELKVNPRTIDKWLKRYEEYRRAYPDEPTINAFVDLPIGRPKRPKLSPDQQKVALFAYLNRDWLAALEDGQLKKVKIKPTMHMVYLLLQRVWPDLEVSEDIVRKFLDNKRREDAGLFALARQGRKVFWAKYVLKRKFDFGAPNVWWISDGRALPLYIRVGDLICTVTLLIIVDGQTRAALGWTLIPRKVEDETGAVKRVDFTEQDVRSLLAHTIYKLGCRPYIWYTDNGSQYKALADVLPDFTDGDDTPIEAIFGKPGTPWSRGVVEVIQGLIDRITVLHPGGFVEHADDDQSWREVWQAAKKNPETLMTLKTFLGQVNAYFQTMWNRRSEDGQPSRWKQWQEGKAQSLPAPSPIRLARLAGELARGEGTVSHTGLLFDKVSYLPISAGGYNRLVDANGKKCKISFIPLAQDRMLILACLDGKSWEEVVPRDQYKPPVGDHVAGQVGSEAYKQKQLDSHHAELMEILRQEFNEEAGVVLAVRSAVAEPLILSQSEATLRLQETRQIEAAARAERKRSMAAKAAAKRKSQPEGASAQAAPSAQSAPPGQSAPMPNSTTFLDDLDALWEDEPTP